MMQNLYEKYKKYIIANPSINSEDYVKAYEYMENSTAIYHGEGVDFLYIPKLYSQSALDFLDKTAKTIYSILSKVIDKYRVDSEYRQLFGFSKELEEWLLLPSQYPCHIPICRLDLFFNEEDFTFKFCEFNADGASAMNKDREIFNAVSQTSAFKNINETTNLKSFELFQTWVNAFIEIYKSTANPIKKPFIAIVDFLESGTTEEFKIFRDTFLKNDYDTEICEIRDLHFDGNALYTARGKKIDAIYRRAVTGELFKKRNDANDFLMAVKAGKVCLIGPLSTQIIHNKILFEILLRDETKAFLTNTEWQYIQKHIPITKRLNDKELDLKSVLSNKNNWIIKPEDLYGSRGVYAGIDQDEETWKKLVIEHKDKGYLLQEFCPPYLTENVEFTPQQSWVNFNNITGLYLYNGNLQGIYSRAGKKGVISSLHQARTMTSIIATEI